MQSPGFETGRLFASVHAEVFGEEPPELMLGRYRIVEILGSGGMGMVYRAYEPGLDRMVALKMVRPRMDSDTRDRYLARFVREGRIMARLEHPHIVTVYEAGREGDIGYLAMELLGGGTTASWAREHPLDEQGRLKTVLDFAVAACRGLIAAHEASIIHRDIKPDNLLLDDAGRLKLADFGVARQEGASEPGPETSSVLHTRRDWTVTQSDEVVGTVRYAAPEQLAGHATEASDQFSLCLSLFELAVGHYPFESALAAGLDDGETLLGRREMPRWLHDVLSRGLATEPSRRHANMGAMLDAIERGRSPSRGRMVALASVAVTAAVAGMLWLGQGGPGCDAFGEPSWWNNARAQSLREVFLQTGEPSAADRADDAVQNIDTYTQQWGAARREVCEASMAGEGDPMNGATLACLERRRGQLEALLEQLGDSTQDVLEHAPTATTSLPTVASCLDVDRLLSLRFDPPAPDVAEQVSVARRAMERSVAQREVGRIAGALKEASAAAEHAAATGYGPVIAEALVELSEVHYARDDRRLALQTARQALVEARRAGHDEMGARAASVLAWADSAPPLAERATFWTEVALSDADVVSLPGFRVNLLFVQAAQLAAGGRLEESLEIYEELLKVASSDRSLAVASTNAASAYLRAGNHDRGAELAEHAAQLFGQVLGPEHPSTMTAWLNVGLGRWGKGDLAGADEAFAAVLRVRETTAGPDAGVTQNVRYNLALVRAERGHLGDAHALMAKARDHYPTGSLERAQTMLELAGIDAAGGDRESTVASVDRALEALRQATESRVVLGEGTLAAAGILHSAGATAAARRTLRDAKAMAGAFEAKSPWMLELERMQGVLQSD